MVGGAGQFIWLPAVQMHFEEISEEKYKETRLRRESLGHKAPEQEDN